MLFRILLSILFGSLTVLAQSAADSAAVRATATAYANAWYNGNGDAMTRALHPSVLKRAFGWSSDHTNNGNVVVQLNAEQILDGTKKKIGARVPEGSRSSTATILFLYNNSASVKLDLFDRYELLHLGRWDGTWKIIDIFWEMKPQD